MANKLTSKLSEHEAWEHIKQLVHDVGKDPSNDLQSKVGDDFIILVKKGATYHLFMNTIDLEEKIWTITIAFANGQL